MADFISKITASSGISPYNGFDSLLEVPNGNNPEQNAWLTVQLNVKFNFVDSKNPNAKLVQSGGKWFAKDWDGSLLPALDWPAHFQDRFSKSFQAHAEKVWNWQFVLITPQTYKGLDFTSFAGPGWVVRPNVLCLFRCGVVNSGAHRVINVYNLDLRATNRIKPDGTTQALSGPLNSRSWRSDDSNYDDRDLFAPIVIDSNNKIVSDTVGHEIGHALGQDHILPLNGVTACTLDSTNTILPSCYGAPGTLNSWNIMGGGNRVYLVNAISWRERMAQHTSTNSNIWVATGMMNTPTRKVSLAAQMGASIGSF